MPAAAGLLDLVAGPEMGPAPGREVGVDPVARRITIFARPTVPIAFSRSEIQRSTAFAGGVGNSCPMFGAAMGGPSAVFVGG